MPFIKECKTKLKQTFIKFQVWKYIYMNMFFIFRHDILKFYAKCTFLCTHYECNELESGVEF